jgi:shikimate kinase
VIVYLVGMPGSGKSTVGRELAGRLGVPFIDLDAEIERQEGRSVAEIFATDGEHAFRALEAAELVRVGARDPSVVACGGGVVLEPANRISLRNTGTCVFIHVPIGELRERVHPASDRPLIQHEGDLERLLQAREPLYREFAAHVVDGRGSPGEVAAAIVEELRWSV